MSQQPPLRVWPTTSLLAARHLRPSLARSHHRSSGARKVDNHSWRWPNAWAGRKHGPRSWRRCHDLYQPNHGARSSRSKRSRIVAIHRNTLTNVVHRTALTFFVRAGPAASHWTTGAPCHAGETSPTRTNAAAPIHSIPAATIQCHSELSPRGHSLVCASPPTLQRVPALSAVSISDCARSCVPWP
jgi:hypothetical protein